MNQESGLVRHARDLPEVDSFVGLGEGETPVLELDVLAGHLGLRGVSAKLESANPTGSYKDRVAAMSMSLALAAGRRGWIATSSGNAGLAMAAYGARAGLPGFLCMVDGAPLEKRLPLAPYPVTVVSVRGVGYGPAGIERGLFEQVGAAAERHDLFLGITAHAFNPQGMRGIDTLAYELAEQCAHVTHVYVPVGGGGLLTAIARGLRHRGLFPRLVACQPTGCAPVVGCLADELEDPLADRCESNISALQLPEPPDGDLAVEAVRTSGGWGTCMPDESILGAQRLLAETEGVAVEPASAAALAGLIRDVHAGRIDAGDHPLLILTGAGWKDLRRFAAETEAVPVVELEQVADRADVWARSLASPVRR